MKTRGGMFSATQVARFCAVDLKTIHNWVNRAKIPAARTAGRHLRFRPLDVVEFLRASGHDVPEGLRSMKLRVLVIDADVVALAEARRLLARRFDVTVAGHVVDGLLAVSTLLPDVLVAGEVSPLDAPTIARRLAAHEATRHVRVVARGALPGLRDRLEKMAG